MTYNDCPTHRLAAALVPALVAAALGPACRRHDQRPTDARRVAGAT